MKRNWPDEGGEAGIFMEMRSAPVVLGCHCVYQDGGITWITSARMAVEVDQAIILHNDRVEWWRLLLDVVGGMVLMLGT